MSEIKIEDYIQVNLPMKNVMKAVVNAMKGSDRPMSDFADVTGVSTSMLSRIVRGDYSKPISIDILQKIASQKATDCSLGLKDLLEANGMMPKEAASQADTMDKKHMKGIENKNRRENMSEIIADELFSRGIAIKKLMPPARRENLISEIYKGTRKSDLIIGLPDERDLVWVFNMIPEIREIYDTGKDDVNQIKRIFSSHAGVFLQDAWNHEESKGIKHSFAFADGIYYKLFIDALSNAKLNNQMSAILIDVDKRIVIDEHCFSCISYPDPKEFFGQPVPSDDESQNEDFGHLSFYEVYNEEDTE